MKQRITQEQMDELTQQQKRKLSDWADPIDSLNWRRTPDGHLFKSELPLLTIGEMIWFLTDYHESLIKSRNWRNYTTTLITLHLSRSSVHPAHWNVLYDYRDDELCDALWATVKNVLAKQIEQEEEQL